MHGNILNQRFNFFMISAFRDHSRLEDNPGPPVNVISEKDPWDDFFTDNSPLSTQIKRNCKILDLRPRANTKKNTNFFYSPTNEWCDAALIPFFGSRNVFTTTNERHLKRHYNRAFSEVNTVILERNISLTDNHLSIRVNRYTKSRMVNAKYFKKNSIAYGVKLNLLTGNFITYSYSGNKKRRTNKIRQNSFTHLLETIKSIFDFKQTFDGFRDNGDIVKQHNEQINDEVFEKTLFHTISSLLDVGDYSVVNPSQNGMINFTNEAIIKLFLKVKKIKVSNNYMGYLTNWYPTQKYLKKNENKLILAILDRLNLKSKSLNRLLHEIPEVNISNLITLSKLFGYGDLHKYIHNLDKRYLSVSTDKRQILNGMVGYGSINNHFEFNLTADEKSRLLKLLNSFFNSKEESNDPEMANLINQQFIQITDHMSMINKIKEFIPDIELRAQNFKDFHHEHIEYSKIERSIQKGYTIQYTFEPRLVEHIESDMEILLDDNGTKSFYPVILKTDGEYSEEGKHMHHCVATYSDREQSIIISIREGDTYGAERVTCEFDTKTKKLVQAKSFCNDKPPKEFESAIEKLSNRIKAFKGSIKSIGKEKVPLIINGVQIELKDDRKPNLDFLLGEIERINNEVQDF